MSGDNIIGRRVGVPVYMYLTQNKFCCATHVVDVVKKNYNQFQKDRAIQIGHQAEISHVLLYAELGRLMCLSG